MTGSALSAFIERSRTVARTTVFQLTLIYVLLFSVSVTLLLAFFYWSTIGLLTRQSDATLEAEVTGLAEQYRQRGLNGLVAVISQRIEADRDGDSIYLFATADYRPLAGNLAQWPQVRPSAGGWLEFSRSSEDGGQGPVRARVYRLRDGLRLLVGRHVGPLRQLETVFDRAVLWGGGMSLLLAFVGGIVMSGRVLGRVGAITETSRDIIAGDLSKRLEVTGSGDEFDVLAAQFNSMLAQIETLIASVKHVSDNVAHDLRTPLTRLRNQLELAARAAPPEVRAGLESCIAEADALLGTFAALLRIARIESGGYACGMQLVDLERLATDAMELYQGVAEEQGQRLTLSAAPGVRIEADRDLLFQAVINLIDNAVKYTPSGGAVTITVEHAGPAAAIVVADTGPGIPAALRERVTERFFRIDRSRSLPGCGLGLSLVRAVAVHHQGQFVVEDNGPGVRAVLTLPAARGE